MFRATLIGICLLAGIVPLTALADANGHGHAPGRGHGEQMEFGMSGETRKVTRTIAVEMSDRFTFNPPALQVRAGETVRLVVRNRGALVHEWILGTQKEIDEHAELMRRYPNMEHDEPQQVRVPPGETRELVWRFNRTGSFTFACLQPGHYEAGMKGTVEVK